MTALILIILILGISALAFWKENPVMFMILAGVSMIVGLCMPDLLDGDYVTTYYGLAAGLGLIAYGFLCCGFTFRLMFWSED